MGTAIEIRPATPDDDAAWAYVWTAANPYLVKTAQDVAWRRLHRSRPSTALIAVDPPTRALIGLADLIHPTPDRPSQARLALAVDPAHRRRGAGRSLLDAATDRARSLGATTLRGIVNDESRSVAFAKSVGVRRRLGTHRVSAVDPRTVPPTPPVPDGLRLLAYADIDDPRAVWRTHNLAVPDDPSGMSPEMPYEEFLDSWWRAPSHRLDLGRALLDGAAVVALSSISADTALGRAWSNMTATHPDHRGRGLGRLVKTAALHAVADVDITQAATANDATNAPMLAVNAWLGYRAVATSFAYEVDLG